MGRQIRLEFEGAVYHITARGNERKKIFLDLSDYEKFLSILNEGIFRYHIILYSYILMNNHYHLLIETPNKGLVKFMHNLNSKYTGYFNKRYKKVGHLFQGRYKSIIVDRDSYLLELIRYIHLNPTRAKQSINPEKYKWSSYNNYIGIRGIPFVEVDFILNQFSKDKEGAIKLFKRFHIEVLDREESIFKKLVSGTILGSEEFIESIKDKVKGERYSDEIVYKKSLNEIYKKREILEKVLEYYQISEDELIKKDGKMTEGQKVGIYLLRKHTGMKIREIGEYFGNRDYTYIPKVINKLEELRKRDKSMNRRIRQIERRILSSFKT